VDDPDLAIRLAAFDHLRELSDRYGDALPRGELQLGFTFEGRRIPLVGPQGIFKPAAMIDMPLSITTAPIVEGKARPYEDEITADGLIVYRYRGTDPQHRENVGLRRAMQAGTPLIYFYGLVPGQYAAAWPSYIVGDDPEQLTFTVAVDEPHVLVTSRPAETVKDDIRRRYATRLQLQRLHQVGFRQRVIRAYQEACAICSLRHRELLDAAHILPDTHPRGEPTVSNGLALCKLHHAAFDWNIVGVRPDLVVEVSSKVLHEIDGPMLIHGLQGFHESKLHIPRSRDDHPNPELLEERYQAFVEAG
jgi:putative restriction endonuclease